ncbi:MCE family protein [Pigmentiphaga aceris]|uniref:MCE family protein n=1 Tax=Pigmentiphaga aceris TaxID=1940612 RepID=A0A5C0AXW5_9BURK|nr:MlaD family protein [Pigmentiphaga aceris]QEI06273.1 MCE family protein [Pigmentiphaga aceris]
MTDPGPIRPASDPAPDPVSKPAPDVPQARRVTPHRRIPSLIWLVPILAAVIGLSLFIKSVTDRGPEITISFLKAEGLEAGKTKIKYKDVDIGNVTSVRLSADKSKALAVVRLNKDASSFAVQGSRFWIVRPRVGAGGVSGLGTLLSGAYLGVDAGKSQEAADEFTGLEVPPPITTDVPGKQFVLQSAELGSLDIGSPIYYRRLPVGQVIGFGLDKTGHGIEVLAFVNAPYDRYVTQDTRFWHASGLQIDLTASGLSVDAQSVASVLAGGIAFQEPPGTQLGEPVAEETEFTLAENQAEAMKNDASAITALTFYNQSLRGLSVGAPVDFRGVVVGEVVSVDIQFDREKKTFVQPVTLRIYPERFFKSAARDSQAILAGMVERGFRAQLRQSSLLTGQLYVAVDFFPKAPAAKLAVADKTVTLPTMPGGLDELQAAVEEIIGKVRKIPFDTIGRNVDKTLVTADKTLTTINTQTLVEINKTLAQARDAIARVDKELTPEARGVLAEARRTLQSASTTLSPDAPLQADVRDTLQELSRTARSLRNVADYLERHPEALLRGKPGEVP